MTRQDLIKTHDHLYTVRGGTTCSYCGIEVSAVGSKSEGDHVPPISRVHEHGRHGSMEKVPCCSDCNSRLSNIDHLLTVEARRGYIARQKGLPVDQFQAQIQYMTWSRTSKKAGEVDTPDDVAESIVRQVPTGLTFLDPVCGDGSFIVARINQELEAGTSIEWINDNIRGEDRNLQLAAQAHRRVRDIHQNLDADRIIRQVEDSLEEMKRMKADGKRFQTVVMNPPFQAWRQFATAALAIADDLYLIMPPRHVGWEHEELVSGIEFPGADVKGKAVHIKSGAKKEARPAFDPGMELEGFWVVGKKDKKRDSLPERFGYFAQNWDYFRGSSFITTNQEIPQSSTFFVIYGPDLDKLAAAWNNETFTRFQKRLKKSKSRKQPNTTTAEAGDLIREMMDAHG